jgi:hypothetical protein
MTDTATNADTTASTSSSSAADAAAAKVGPMADKAKAFAKEKPFAVAALAGVLGIALINTLRGKGRTS